MLNAKNRFFIFLILIIGSVSINAVSFFLMNRYFSVKIETAYVLLSNTLLIILLAYSIIINSMRFARKKILSKLLTELETLEIPEISKAFENFEKDGFEFATSKLIRAISKINNSFKKINEQYADTTAKILNFTDELEMLKVNADTNIKTSIINTDSLKKIGGDFNDFLYEKENFIKMMKAELYKSIEIIEEKFKKKEHLSEFVNKLTLAMIDVDKTLNTMNLFCAELQNNQTVVLSAINEMLANIEKQSINILNFYIFSHPEKTESADVQSSENISFEREENINNIKSINELIKTEVYKIKNILTILFESNKSFSVELNENRFIFTKLKSYLQQIPVILNNFSSVDLTIKTNLHKFQNTSSKFSDKLKNEMENLKNMNIKLNNINKSLEDLKTELHNLSIDTL